MQCEVVSQPPKSVSSYLKEAFFGGEQICETVPIHAAYIHHFLTPGGGARVGLTQSCSSLLGISEENSNRLAAAVECLHNASLVQDDLQDESAMRRGRESVVSKFGIHIALGLTDRLITSSFACLAGVTPSSALPRLILQINRAVAEIVEGQIGEFAQGTEIGSLENRLDSSKKKSGPLFALTIELPLILANQLEYLEPAHRGGCLFGLGYQFLDDLTDQAADADHSSNGNLILAMKEDAGGDSAAPLGAELARGFFRDAVTQVEKLPHGAGEPLIDLAKRLCKQLDAFDS
jgi:geranylgeranyl diphosphate synthase type II